jgi:hypothetical protein
MKFLIDGKSFVINNPKLKGYRGANILSQIEDYRNSCTIDTTKPNMAELLKLCKLADVTLEDLNSTDEAKSKQSNDKIQELVLNDSSLLISVFGQSGNVKILFDVISDILEYYKTVENLETELTSDDFTKSDIFDVIRYLKSEPKNEIQDFLGLTAQKSREDQTSLVSEIQN